LVDLSEDAFGTTPTARFSNRIRTSEGGDAPSEGAADGPDLRSKGELFMQSGAEKAREGSWEEAIMAYEKGLNLFRKIGHLAGVATAQKNIGNVFTEMGMWDEAIKWYKAALSNAGRAGDVVLTAGIYNNLGVVLNSRGDWEKAISCYRASVRIYNSVGYRRGMAYAYNNLGMSYTDRREWHRAQKFYSDAMEIAVDIGELHLEATIHLNAAEAYLGLEELSKAKFECDKAIEISRKLKDKLGEAEAYKLYGVIYRALGDYSGSEGNLRLSIDMNLRCRSPLGAAEGYRELGLTYHEMGDDSKALQFLGESLSIFRKLRAKKDFRDVSRDISDLENIYLSVAREMGGAVEAKDLYTFGHSKRVSGYSLELAKEIGLGSDDIKGILVAAYLHDLGKVAISREILCKPGKLTPEEYEVIKTHTIAGVEKLASIKFPWDVKPLIRHHHERYDGSGYPDHLEGDSIPLGARVIAIADCYDAMTTTRPYRPAWGVDETLDVIASESGKAFDPQLTEAFINMINRKRDTDAPVIGDGSVSDIRELWRSSGPAQEPEDWGEDELGIPIPEA